MKMLQRFIMHTHLSAGLILISLVGGLSIHATVNAQPATEPSVSDASIRSLITAGAFEQAEDRISVRYAALQGELALARYKLTGDRRHCLAAERWITDALSVNQTEPNLLSIAGRLFLTIDKYGKAARLLEKIDAQHATYSESQALLAIAYGRMVNLQWQLFENGVQTRQWDDDVFVSVADDGQATDEPRASRPTDLDRVRWLGRADDALDKARKSATPSATIHYAEAYLIKVEGEFRGKKPSETQPAMLRAYATYLDCVEPSVLNYQAVAFVASRLKAAGRPVPAHVTTKLDRLQELATLVLQRQRLEQVTRSDVAFQAVNAIFANEEKLGIVAGMEYAPDGGLIVQISSDVPPADLRDIASSADFGQAFTDVSIRPGKQGQTELILQLNRRGTDYKVLPDYSDEQLKRIKQQTDDYWKQRKTSPSRRFEQIAPWMADHVVFLHEVSFSGVAGKTIPALMSEVRKSLGDVLSAPASIKVVSRGGVYDLTYSLHIFFDQPAVAE